MSLSRLNSRTPWRFLSTGSLSAVIGGLVLCVLLTAELFSAIPPKPRKPGEPEKVVDPAFVPRPKPELTPTERKEKAAELLAKYPLVSIADRLAGEAPFIKANKEAPV